MCGNESFFACIDSRCGLGRAPFSSWWGVSDFVFTCLSFGCAYLVLETTAISSSLSVSIAATALSRALICDVSLQLLSADDEKNLSLLFASGGMILNMAADSTSLGTFTVGSFACWSLFFFFFLPQQYMILVPEINNMGMEKNHHYLK